jgi:hypothetical protein
VDALGRPSAELYRGGRLETALEWRDAAAPDLTEVEAEFLDASAEAADSDRRALAAEAKRQARQNRRLRWALAAAAVLLVAAVAGGLVAVRQRQETNQQRRVAALSALVGDSMALRSNRRDLAALLAVEAHRLAPNAESESALLGTFTAAPGAERILHTGLSLAVLGTDAAFMPDGRTLVISDERGAIHLIDLETARPTSCPRSPSATAGRSSRSPPEGGSSPPGGASITNPKSGCSRCGTWKPVSSASRRCGRRPCPNRWRSPTTLR